MLIDDKNFMREALLEAKKAFAEEEVPVGAVLVHQGNIIARAHNKVEGANDASCHAELLCLKLGCEILQNWRQVDCTLYCTLEPCAMCAGAMILFRIKRLVYGAPDLRHGADGSIFSILREPHPIHQLEVTGGVMKEESQELLQEFFRHRRAVNARRPI